jgi:DNA-binding transcriptional LysR family regulator
LLEQAQRTLMQAELTQKVIRREAENLSEVRVNFIGPALYRILPELLLAYRAVKPDVHVRLFESSSPEQISMMSSGDFDIGFVTAGFARDVSDKLLVERVRFIAAVPASWPIAEQECVSLDELAEQPFILPPQRYAEQSSEIMATFKRAGAVPRVAQEATQTNTTVRLVGAGLGCSIVIATAKLMPTYNVRFLEIKDRAFPPFWEMYMIWNPEYLSPQAQDFVRFSRGFVAEHPELIDVDSPINQNEGDDISL